MSDVSFLPVRPSERNVSLEERVGYDVWLLVLTLALCVYGAVFVLSASSPRSWQLYHGNATVIFWNHVGRLVMGLGALAVLALTDYHILKKAARALLGLSLLLLITVLFVPQPAGATAHRWLHACGFSFQPAELAKFALINYLALRFSHLELNTPARERQRTYTGTLVVTLATVALILLEPNLSMALLILGCATMLFFLGGAAVRPLLIFCSACALPLLLLAWFTPYMNSRLTSFVAGIMNPMRASYHVSQSLIGIGQGGITGLGLGGSSQKFFFLPEPHKDFVFSIIAEEQGLIGATAVLTGFVLLLARAWRIMRRAPDRYGRFLGAGIAGALALSLVVSVGVAVGLLPATGQPLPFMSYGGTSLIITLAAVGVLLNISRQALAARQPFAGSNTLP